MKINFKKKYSANWVTLFKNMTRHLYISTSLAIAIPLIFFLILRFIKLNFDFAETVKHFTITGLFLFLAIYILSIPLISMVFSTSIKLMSVSIKNNYLHGCSLYLPFQKIYIPDIVDVGVVNNYGITAYRAITDNNKQILFSTHTEDINELLEYIAKNSKINQ